MSNTMTPSPIEATPLLQRTIISGHHCRRRSKPTNTNELNQEQQQQEEEEKEMVLSNDDDDVFSSSLVAPPSSSPSPSSPSATVLQRIVTSASSLLVGNSTTTTHHHSSSNTDANNDGGDIVASIVLQLRDTTSNDCSSSNFTNGNNSSANGSSSSSSRKTVLMVQRMDGTTVASFDLPSSSTFASARNVDDYAMDNIDGANNIDVGNGGLGGRVSVGYKYNDALLCWASFRHVGKNNAGGSSNTSTRKMLCALGNPETLFVYDVLGDMHVTLDPSSSTTTTTTTSSSTPSSFGGGDCNTRKKGKQRRGKGSGGGLLDGGGGGPGGYTIPLPFRAQSIFPNGDDAGGGLLIVRAPSREDYTTIGQPVQQQQQYPHPMELQVDDIMNCNDDEDHANTDGNDARLGHRRRRRRSSSPMTPMGLSLPATPRSSSMTRQQRRRCDSTDDGDDEEDNHPSLEDPPVPLRYLEKGGSMFAGSGGSGAVAAEAVMEGSSGGFNDDEIDYNEGGGVPCLFSLRHPLDEIHPLAVVVDGRSMTHQQQQHDEGNANGTKNDNLELFTNIMETLVFVGSPRLFHGTIPFHATTTTSPICVTYNARKNRHTFWSLSNAVYPMETLPLWKTTGRGAWQSASVMPSRGMVTQETDDDNKGRQGTHLDDENNKLVDEDDQIRQLLHEQQEGYAPSSVSDIHPEFALKKLFVDDTLPSAVGIDYGQGVDNDGEAKGAMVTQRRHIFLATDLNARGDLVVCVFAPNSQGDVISMNSSAAEEGNAARFGSPVSVLRCFALHLPEPLLPLAVDTGHQHKVSVSIQSVSHLVDIPCSSAQPMRSIPIPLAPFARKDNSVNGTSQNRSRKCTSRFHNQDRDTFATDILIVPHRLQVGSCWPIFRLHRAGTIHVADFTLPQTTLDAVDSCSSTSSSLSVNIENSVGNRVDIHFFCPDGLLDASVEGITASTEKKYSQTTAIVRASFSLLMHTSSISETALRAIESSLVYNTAESTTEQFPASSWGVNLSLLIRSDVVRLFQQRSSVGRGNIIPNNVEDAGWYSLTVVLMHLLGMKRSSEEEQVGACAHQTGRKNTKKQSSAAWEDLLQSEYHSSFCSGEGAILFGAVDEFVENSFRTQGMSIRDCVFTAELLSVLPFVTNLELDAGRNDTPTYAYMLRHHIFDSLHLLHEDSRLVSTSRGFSWTLRLGTFLMHIAKQMNPMMIDYEDHYHRLLGTSRCQSNACTSYFTPKKEKHRLSTFAISPCIMTFLDGIIQLDLDDYSLEDASYWVAGYNVLLQSTLNGVLSTTWMVLRLFVLRFDRKNILSGNSSVIDAEPIKSHRDRAVILAMLDEGIYHPFQLQDELPMGVVLPLLEIIASCRLDPPHVDSTRELWPPAAYDLVGRNDVAEFLAQSKDGSHGILFADDASPSDDPDGDGLSALDKFASLTFPDNRIRDAAKLLRSSHPLFLNAPRPVELSDHDYERSKQEKLLLLCRRSIALPLGRGMLTLGTHSVQSAEQLLIPNIVLAGRVPPMNGILALDTTALPSNFRVWPEFHNGVAAGLRLPQATKDEHSRQVTRTWIKFNKPMSASDNSSPSYSHGGILMALGLRGYLSALTTTDLTDYLTQGIITTTVGLFVGLAADQRGSCNPSVSKMLCLHLPSLLPPSFLPMDLASPVQAAAIAAIGLLYLGSSHRLMTEFLLNEIGRPPVKDQNATDREGLALVCGLSLGMVNLSRGASTVSGLEDLHIEERLQRYILGVTDESESTGQKSYFGVGASQGDMDRNSRIYEANSLNRDITAPGATLAIGLMYIRSHNVSIAASLQLPDTHFLLDYIRPDLLSLRVISRSLILWNDIQPTSSWIDSQIPIIVKQSITLMKDAAVRVMKMGNADEMSDPTEPERGNNMNKISDFEPQAIRQAHAYIIAGACFSLGLKYAGSANRFAAAAIIERTLWFLELRDNKDVVTLTQRPDNSTLITCLCMAANSLAMVMAGTGDLDSFRLFRALRWKCDESTLHGAHMAFGAAIGLLFLGGGKCTLGSSPEDVAMLIASFYPHLPMTSSDNQYHLQALRHLYVLASQQRILEACDVDSNEKVCIPIELRVANSDDIALTSTPFLFANGTTFVQLSLKSDRYNPIVINVSDWSDRSDLPTLFVKRKAGHLSYLQDPNGLLSLSLQQGGSAGALMKSVKLFSDSAILTSFAKYFCSASVDDDNSFESFCSDIAYECMKEGKSDDALVMILRVFRLIDLLGRRKSVSIENIWDAKLITTFSTASTSLLINREQLALLRERADDSVYNSLPSVADMQVEKWWERYDRHFGSVLVWKGVPLLSCTTASS